MSAPTPADVAAARKRGRSVVLHTPIVGSAHLSTTLGHRIVFKAENLQRTGAFKIRGAMNVIDTLGEEAARGVVAGSAGNHAQGLALAARELGVPCEIHVPRGASIAKVAACIGYGATVVESGERVEDAVAAARARADEAGMSFCHPYDDARVVAGQATLGLEVLEDVDDLTAIVVPLGGGGLLGGVAAIVKRMRPEVKVYGVQIEGCAPYVDPTDVRPGLSTLADGIAVKDPGVVTRPLIEAYVDEVVRVGEDSVAEAMVMLLERAKLLVEGGGAVGVSALLTGAITPPRSGTTCVVLSGGNVDVGLLPSLVLRSEAMHGRRMNAFVRLPDVPGALAGLLEVLAGNEANIIEVSHVRQGVDLHSRETGVLLVLETRNRRHAERVLAAANDRGFVIHEFNYP